MIKRILYVLLCVALFLLAYSQYVNVVNSRHIIKGLDRDNKELLEKIQKKDTIIYYNSLKIDSLIARENILMLSIENMEEAEKNISKKYEKIYLNPNTTNWHLLDSLSSILLNNKQQRSSMLDF